MTYAPQSIQALAGYWVARGGTDLGIVGNAAHVKGYHLGRDRIYDGAGPGLGDADYSVQTARDKAGLTNAASAIDLGKLDGSLVQLRAFSRWFVERCRANAPGTSDVREFIYSPDGKVVLRWDRERGFASAPRTGEADDSHTGHSHASFYRDSEARDKVAAIRAYFEQEDTVQAAITDETQGGVLMDVPLNAPLLELDGKTFIRRQPTALSNRWSPYGVGPLRAMLAEVGGSRQIVLVKPSAVRPIPVPVVDCTPSIAAAVAPLQTDLTAARARLAAIKSAGGW